MYRRDSPKFYYFLFILIITVAGCATEKPQLTPLQRKVIESKEFEGSYNDVLKATISVLQDKGYQIVNSDYQGGIISAETPRQAVGFWGGKISYRATINLEKFTADRATMRLAVYSQAYNSIGLEIPAVLGNAKFKSGYVDDPQVYQDFYSEIQQEMFRREQLNK